MTQGSLCFSDLPDACVVEVLKRLDERSALTFQSTSKWVLGLAQWSTIWASKLEALCGLKVASWHLKGSKELQRALRWDKGRIGGCNEVRKAPDGTEWVDFVTQGGVCGCGWMHECWIW